MLTSPAFKELLKIFEKHKIRYLIIGGYAVMKYSEPRFNKDLDVFIATDQENAKGVYSASKEFVHHWKTFLQMISLMKDTFIRWEGHLCESIS